MSLSSFSCLLEEVNSEVDVLGGGVAGVVNIWGLVVVFVIVVLIVIINAVVGSTIVIVGVVFN